MLLCFSGTGNTRLVACELQRHLGGELLPLTAQMLRAPRQTRLQLPSSSEPVIWCMPIYSWGMPPLVRRLLQGVQLQECGERTPHYLVCTCGDDIGTAHHQWAQTVQRRGWNPQGSFSVQMPNTYICMEGYDVDAPEVAAAKIQAMPRRVADIAQRIARGWRGEDVVEGRYAWLKTALVHPMFIRFCISPRQFTVDTDRCTSCGRCAKLCPLENITLDREGHPLWGSVCAHCLACLHACPSQAIDYGIITRGKQRYRSEQ